MTSNDASNNLPAGYEPPKVWTWDPDNGGKFANINRPTAGATHDKTLPVGKHPLQLYSLATPNGIKVSILLEELLAAGHSDAEYDAWLIEISGDQFGSDFVNINPNSKIPALTDHAPKDGGEPIHLFESASILTYLAEKFDSQFISKNTRERAEILNWLFWQMASAPFMGGGFGHFYTYAPIKIKYAIDRYSLETKRLFDVLDKRLADSRFIAGTKYSIADMAAWPWFGEMTLGNLYEGAAEFLTLSDYKNVHRWAQEIAERPAVQRGRKVNRTWGAPSEQLHERHDASDFDTKTADKTA